MKPSSPNSPSEDSPSEHTPPGHATPHDAAPVGAGPRSPGPDRSLPLLLAAGVLVVAVVLLVVFVGIQRPPSLDPIDAAPALVPPGSVAWIDYESDGGCLRRVDTAGSVHDVTCDVEGEVVAWDTRGILLRAWMRDSERLVAIDPESGDRRPLEGLPTEPGMEVFTSPWTEREDGRLRVSVFGEDDDTAQDPRTVWEVEAPDGYDIISAAVSPDGDFVALGDNAGRLLIVPADGSTPPRVWTEQVPRYVTVVWEGTPMPAPEA